DLLAAVGRRRTGLRPPPRAVAPAPGGARGWECDDGAAHLAPAGHRRRLLGRVGVGELRGRGGRVAGLVLEGPRIADQGVCASAGSVAVEAGAAVVVGDEREAGRAGPLLVGG